jgi:hypothetical protein
MGEIERGSRHSGAREQWRRHEVRRRNGLTDLTSRYTATNSAFRTCQLHARRSSKR